MRTTKNGATPIADRRPAVQVLTATDEQVVFRYILDLKSRGFQRLIEDVREMANRILASGSGGPIASYSERKSSVCAFLVPMTSREPSEDPELIKSSSHLFLNMRNKYGILDCDLYKFDETGFMMRVICPSVLITRLIDVAKVRLPNLEIVSGRPRLPASVMTVSTSPHFCSSKAPTTWPVGTPRVIFPARGSSSPRLMGGQITRQA